MVLALLTLIRPLQAPPVWTVQKAAADRIEARRQAASHKAMLCGTRDTAETRPAP